MAEGRHVHLFIIELMLDHALESGLCQSKITRGMFMKITAKIMTYNISILTTALALGKDGYILLLVFLPGFLHSDCRVSVPGVPITCIVPTAWVSGKYVYYLSYEQIIDDLWH